MLLNHTARQFIQLQLVERAAGEVCDRCRRIDPTTKERSYNATICDHCASIVEENFAEGVAEGFEVKAK